MPDWIFDREKLKYHQIYQSTGEKFPLIFILKELNIPVKYPVKTLHATSLQPKQ